MYVPTSDTNAVIPGQFGRWIVQLSEGAPWDIAQYPPIAIDSGTQTPSTFKSNPAEARNAALDALALDARQVRYDLWELHNTRWMIRQVQSMRMKATGIIRGPVFRRLAEAQGVSMVFEGTEDSGRQYDT